MTRLLPTFLLSACLAACGGPQTGSQTANPCGDNPCGDNPCGANPCGDDGMAAAGASSFSDWQSFTKANDKRFFSKGHGKMYVDVYVESEHLGVYKAGTTAPVGMRVVKAQYKTADSADTVRLTVMRKEAAGYDVENGDWYYGVFDAKGEKAMKEGKIEMCIDCHDSASKRDYLFGPQ